MRTVTRTVVEVWSVHEERVYLVTSTNLAPGDRPEDAEDNERDLLESEETDSDCVDTFRDNIIKVKRTCDECGSAMTEKVKDFEDKDDLDVCPACRCPAPDCRHPAESCPDHTVLGNDSGI